MSEDLEKRIDVLEAQLERSMGQLAKLVDFMGNLSAAVGQMMNSWTEERTVANNALNGHKEGIEQLVKAQTQIASAVDKLSQQCSTMFKMQTERLSALEAAGASKTQHLN
jgi:methyl-accepting chemotaxis protein